MRCAAALALAAMLAGCRSEVQVEGKAPDNAVESEPESATAARQLKLDAAAQQKAGIAVEQVSRRSIRETISATGQLVRNEDRTWHVGAIVDGRIVSVELNVGDPVRAGQVLARLHSHEVHDSRAAYEKALAELARLQSVEAQARRVRDRARRLFDLKAASQEQVEIAETDLRTAQANVKSAQSEVEKERVHLVEFLDVPLEEDHSGKQHEGDLIPIRSPAAGVLLERKVTPGSAVSAGEQVFTVSNLSSLWLLAAVNEADLANLRTGQPVTLRVRAYPDRQFRGRILKLGEELDPETRSLRVRVLVPNDAGRLKPEMFASVEIERGASREGLFVPEEAAQEIGGHRVVFVRTAPDTFEPRPIEVERVVNGEMEIIGGLSGGEKVVVKGSFLLKSQLLKNSLAE